MLILKRKLNESIIIGDSIEVKITDIQGDSVKLGITAPRDISVFREELYRQIKDMNIKASGIPENEVDNIQKFLS